LRRRLSDARHNRIGSVRKFQLLGRGQGGAVGGLLKTRAARGDVGVFVTDSHSAQQHREGKPDQQPHTPRVVRPKKPSHTGPRMQPAE
jgi:hypothetical protein